MRFASVRRLGREEADVEVVDVDLGLGGAAAEHRRGFKDLIAASRWARSGSSCPTTSPGSPAIARTGIRCSTCAAIASA